ADGSHTVVAAETDLAGNSGVALMNFTLDTRSPTVTAIIKNDTGASSTDHITNDSTLTGSGDALALVRFVVDGSPIATTVMADASGIWVFRPAGLTDGTHTILASETDLAGNTGTASLAFTFDTHAPVPSITSE